MGEFGSEVDEVRRENERKEQHGGGDRSMATDHRSSEARHHCDERHRRQQPEARQADDGQQRAADHRVAMPVPVVVVRSLEPVTGEIRVDALGRALAVAQRGTSDRRFERVGADGVAKTHGGPDALGELVDLIAVRRLVVLLRAQSAGGLILDQLVDDRFARHQVRHNDEEQTDGRKGDHKDRDPAEKGDPLGS